MRVLDVRVLKLLFLQVAFILLEGLAAFLFLLI
jgi:hypothetical protein